MQNEKLWQIMRDEFPKIVACRQCPLKTNENVLRDGDSNIPQPGIIGTEYFNRKKKRLYIGQNPKVNKNSNHEQYDKKYIFHLKQIKPTSSNEELSEIYSVMLDNIKQWNYSDNFPFGQHEYKNIAFFNFVRCRRKDEDKSPTKITARRCCVHLARWIELLQPDIITFIGKWACRQYHHLYCNILSDTRKIDYWYTNNDRHLSLEQKRELHRCDKLLAPRK